MASRGGNLPMKRILLGLLIVLALILAGCGPVMSLFPLYKDADFVTEDSVIGQWSEQDFSERSDKNPLEQRECCWKIEKGGNGSYNISIPMGKGNPHHTRVAIRFLKLDGKFFVDAEPPDIDLDKDKSTDMLFPVVGAHIFGRIWIEKDEIKMKLLDQDWLRDAILGKRIHLDYVYTKGALLLAANTDDLQRFAIQFADDKDAFGDGYDLIRKK